MYLKREWLYFVVTETPIMNRTHSLIHLIIAAVKLRQKPYLNTFSSVCESGETTFISSYLLEHSNETPAFHCNAVHPLGMPLILTRLQLCCRPRPTSASCHLPHRNGGSSITGHFPFYLPQYLQPYLQIPGYPTVQMCGVSAAEGRDVILKEANRPDTWCIRCSCPGVGGNHCEEQSGLPHA